MKYPLRIVAIRYIVSYTVYPCVVKIALISLGFYEFHVYTTAHMLYYKDKMYWYVMYSLPWQISCSCIRISQNRSGASSPLHLVAPQTGLLWTVVKPRNLINLSLDVTIKASNDTCCCCSLHVTFSLTSPASGVVYRVIIYSKWASTVLLRD